MHTQGHYFIGQLFIQTISCDSRQHSNCHYSKFVSWEPLVLVQRTAISIRFLLTTLKKKLEILSFSLQTLVTYKKQIAHNPSNSAGKINNSIFWMLSYRLSTVQNLLVYVLFFDLRNKYISHQFRSRDKAGHNLLLIILSPKTH